MIFDACFVDFSGEIGDIAVFKNAHRNNVEWTIVGVEPDWQACRWGRKGRQPMFIQLERSSVLAGNKHRTERVWTSPNQISVRKRK